MGEATPLRIVHVLRAPMGGVLRHVRDLAIAQSAAGHDVGIICDAPGNNGYSETALDALAPALSLGLHRVAMARAVGIGDIAAARKVLAALKPLTPDIVHGHGAKGGVYARAIGGMAHGAGRPARFYSPHGGSLHHDPATTAGRIYFGVERMLERACEAIIFVAAFERNAYQAKVGTPRCPTHIVHNGLSDAEFAPVQATADARDFLFIGEMRMLKGPDLFVEAMIALRAQGRRVTAIMIGDGPDHDTISGRIAAAGLGDAIALRPAMPARDAFALARTMVMPSRAEAMPYIILEALAAGLPVIATDVGGIGEIMGAHCPALVAPDAAALAVAMAAALDEPGGLRATMPSRATLKRRFSIDAMAAGVMEVYRQGLANVRHLSDSGTPRAAPSNVS